MAVDEKSRHEQLILLHYGTNDGKHYIAEPQVVLRQASGGLQHTCDELDRMRS